MTARHVHRYQREETDVYSWMGLRVTKTSSLICVGCRKTVDEVIAELEERERELVALIEEKTREVQAAEPDWQPER